MLHDNAEESTSNVTIAAMKKEIRVLKKKLARSEANRCMLEEALDSHIRALKVSNSELTKTHQAVVQSEATYRKLALYDSLTSLPGRILLQERLQRAVLRAKRTKSLLAVLFVDLDKFKEVNDHGGHAAGDMVLRTTAQRLCACVRDVDTVARLAGDEFVIVLEKSKDKQAIISVAKRIITEMSAPMTLLGVNYLVSASIGISIFRKGECSTEELIEMADAAMYEVKRTEKPGWKFYGDDSSCEGSDSSFGVK